MPETVGFADGHLYVPGPQFELVTVDPGVPVVTSATPYLTGQGGVVAIGTWDIVPHGVDEPGNGRFAANLLHWLSGRCLGWEAGRRELDRTKIVDPRRIARSRSPAAAA